MKTHAFSQACQGKTFLRDEIKVCCFAEEILFSPARCISKTDHKRGNKGRKEQRNWKKNKNFLLLRGPLFSRQEECQQLWLAPLHHHKRWLRQLRDGPPIDSETLHNIQAETEHTFPCGLQTLIMTLSELEAVFRMPFLLIALDMILLTNFWVLPAAGGNKSETIFWPFSHSSDFVSPGVSSNDNETFKI